ncbi:MAG: hypothetical protein EPGJADBJ_05441 [Saprospiraceae bacterium]|nr:hypothetical protein [Saprospiraceae bacterium]
MRDEGAYYGLVEGDTREKENAIRQYFDVSIQSLRTGIEIDHSAFRLLDEELARLGARIAGRQVEKESWQNPGDYARHFFFRYVLGFAIYSLMLLFNFGLIYETLGQSSRFPLWISLGVYLFGMLSLIRRMAIVYSDEREVVPENMSPEQRWKIYAEEIGIPLIAALFVVLYGKPPGPAEAALLFLLIFALFIYAGKGFWQSWLHLQQEYGILKNNRITRRNRAAKVAELEKDIQQLKLLMDQKRQEALTLQTNIRSQSVEMARSEAQKAAAIHYFKSEFDLARSTKRMGIFG